MVIHDVARLSSRLLHHTESWFANNNRECGSTWMQVPSVRIDERCLFHVVGDSIHQPNRTCWWFVQPTQQRSAWRSTVVKCTECMHLAYQHWNLASFKGCTLYITMCTQIGAGGYPSKWECKARVYPNQAGLYQTSFYRLIRSCCEVFTIHDRQKVTL